MSEGSATEAVAPAATASQSSLEQELEQDSAELEKWAAIDYDKRQCQDAWTAAPKVAFGLTQDIYQSWQEVRPPAQLFRSRQSEFIHPPPFVSCN